MRRLAQEKAGITSRIKLDQILVELKDRGILQGAEPGVAQSFLKFRNDSLHADWNNVTEPQVTSCLGLLDSLIVKHFEPRTRCTPRGNSEVIPPAIISAHLISNLPDRFPSGKHNWRGLPSPGALQSAI
jgi:hypothetical protein